VKDEVRDNRQQLLALINGFMLSQALHAFTVLGLADLIGDRRLLAADLATAVKADPAAVNRLLRALAAAGVLDEDEQGGFALTPVGEGLREDATASLAGWTALVGSENFWANWGRLTDSVRTGETGWRLRLDVDAWDYRAQHPEENQRFDRGMVSITSASADTVAEDYDFSRFATIVDVGGGRGTLLAQVLGRNPAAAGILFDQPHVVEGAAPLLEAHGVLERCQVVGGSFFESVPEGGDAYVLKSVLHDWYDPEALRILATVRAAMRPGAVLLVVERILAPPNHGLSGKLGDLNMLVNPGGRERTREEWEALLAAGGFGLSDVHATRGLYSVLVSTPV
jgi:O-methyltransferase/methyltransferase family protein